MPIFIREEQPADVPDIRRVNELAFGQPAEALVVDALREAGALTFSFVAVEDGEIVGHIAFSPVELVTAVGVFAGLGLAPMAVVPPRQNAGLGTQLVFHALERSRVDGHPFVVVLGHPEYYPRFGFTRASRYGIHWEQDAPDEAFMMLELQPGALRGRGGVIKFRPEFTGL